MSGKRMIYVALLLGLVGLAFAGWKLTSRTAYETAEYAVVKTDGKFEIREYPDLMMATTNMALDQRNGGDGSFSRLFRYITGANDGKQKIAMTTPVFMESQENAVAGQMGFVMPKKFDSEASVPSPTNSDVKIRQRSGGKFAVLRFAGRMERDSPAAEQRLVQWIKDNGLQTTGEFEYAGYDPPWTPGPFRRNEVLIRLDAAHR